MRQVKQLTLGLPNCSVAGIVIINGYKIKSDVLIT